MVARPETASSAEVETTVGGLRQHGREGTHGGGHGSARPGVQYVSELGLQGARGAAQTAGSKPGLRSPLRALTHAGAW